MVGYIIASIKTVSDTRIGDTITLDANPAAAAAPRLQGSEAGGLRLHLSRFRRTITRTWPRPWKNTS